MQKQLHPIEVILLIGMALVAALITVTRCLLLPLLASLLAMAPQRQVQPLHQAPEPLVHPLALIAADLEQLTRRQLQAMAGTTSNHSKARLASLVAASC